MYWYTKAMRCIDTIIHRWLRVPYTLHTFHYQKGKRGRPTIVFLHGIGNTGAAWSEVINTLPKDLTIYAFDLLGFGQSPRPSWAKYNVRTQARSIVTTLLRKGVIGPVYVVGHSLGALVAIELAQHRPRIVSQLLLCSPPLYRSDEEVGRLSRERSLRQLYRFISRHPKEFISIGTSAMKLGIVNPSFTIDEQNVASFMATLETSIVNQKSYQDAQKLTMPTHILVGKLDPVVIIPNLTKLAKQNPHITVTQLTTGHELLGSYLTVIAETIKKSIK